MGQAEIYTGVNAKLVASTGGGTFYADVGGRIYQDFAPANATLPFSIFSITSDPPLMTFTSNTNISSSLSCEVWGSAASGPAVIRAISDKLVALLHKATLTISGASDCTSLFTDQGLADRIEDAILITTTFQITGSD